jgi:elongation factor G
VTDFLPAERARGITIQSAAITFHWPPLPQGLTPEQSTKATSSNTINLIDTPGHADFTFEVVRSLRILDGAVCILDGVAGVEAQTEKVMHQARGFNIPCIIYVNKLDRDGAAFGRTVKEVGTRLGIWPAVCQIPWWEGGKGKFVGVGDAIGLRAMKWEDGDGTNLQVYNLEELEKVDSDLAAEIRKARIALVELLSEHDDDMVMQYLENDEDHCAIKGADITASLRKCILNGNQKIIPVLAGASFRNIGVQPLLDAIVDLLPTPEERPPSHIKIGNTNGTLEGLVSGNMQLETVAPKEKGKNKKKVQAIDSGALVKGLEACALAFKVVHDTRRGMLVYVRVYSGTLNKSALLYNTNLQTAERAPRLLRMYAQDAVEIDSIPSGQIGVIAGLKHARTGDTLISYVGANPKNGPPFPLNTLQLKPIEVPPPVFFVSVEPNSLSEGKNVEQILDILLREDPSLHITLDEDSGQTLLSGMGELHLEIAAGRLVGDFKAKAEIGKIEIGYRECVLKDTPKIRHLFERDIGGKLGKVACEVSVAGLKPDFAILTDETIHSFEQDGNQIQISLVSSDDLVPPTIPAHLSQEIFFSALSSGIVAALSRGPRFSFPVYATSVELSIDQHNDLFGSESTPGALTAAARVATTKALRAAETALMEPVMNVSISLDEESLGTVVQDISSARGGHVLSLDEDIESDIERLDVTKIYAPRDPFATSVAEAISPTGNRTIMARVPLKEMVGYLKHLRSMTKGRGSFIMSVDRFERLSTMREKATIAEMGL